MATTSVNLVKAWPFRTDRHLLHHMLRAERMRPDAITSWLTTSTRKSIHAYATEVLDWVTRSGKTTSEQAPGTDPVTSRK